MAESHRDRAEIEAENRLFSREPQRFSLIPFKNVFALVAYYLAFASLIVILGTFTASLFDLARSPVLYKILMFGVSGILAVLAVLLGFAGVAKSIQNPRIKGLIHSVVAIVMGLVDLVGLACLYFFGFPINFRT